MNKQMTEYDFSKLYDDMLDECYEPIKIMGITYNVSYVLKNVDEIAYREGLLNYADSEGIELI